MLLWKVDAVIRRMLGTLNTAINVTWFFPFWYWEGTRALQRPVAVLFRDASLLITNNQFAYLSWIVEDTNVSTYCSLSVTCASWQKSQRSALSFPLSEQWLLSQILCAWRERLASPLWTASWAWVSITYIKNFLWVFWVLSGKMFCFLNTRRLMLLLVWVLTIIQWKVSRHNADMYPWSKRVQFSTLPFFEFRKQNVFLFSGNYSLIKS